MKIEENAERRDRSIDQLSGHGAGGTSIRRGSSSTTTSVSHRTVNPDTVFGQSQRAGDLVAVGGARVESINSAYRDPRGTQEVEDIGGSGPDDMDHEIAGLTPATSVSAAYHRNASRWKRGWSSTTQLNRPSEPA